MSLGAGVSKISNIQHLRALAALLVVFGHAVGAVDENVGDVAGPARLLSKGAQFGVDIFFVISGFIMYHTSARRFGAQGGSAHFIRRRIVRIVPIYWLVTLVSAALLIVVGKSATIGELLQSLAFIPYDGDGEKMRPIVGVGWTLNFEMFFYAIFAIALLLPRTRGLAFIFGFLALMAALGSIFTPPPPARAWTSPILLEFAIGVALGVLHERFRPSLRLPVPALVPAIAVVILCCALPPSLAYGHGLDWQIGWRPAPWILAGAAVLSALAVPQSQDRTLFGKTATAIGDASYSLYLVHGLTFAALNRVVGRVGLTADAPDFLAVAGYVLAAVATGWIVFKFVEQPATGAIDALASRRSPNKRRLKTS